MAIPTTASAANARRDRLPPDTYVDTAATSACAVSWGAVFAGAAGAAALSLILLILGTGLGLSSVSPWSYDGISKTTFGVSTIVWVTFTQLVASGMGGYLAGRLRTKWVDAHRDEVYFRDTAHGFLAWSVSSLATAALLGSVVGAITHTGIQAGASAASGLASTAVAATTGAAAMADSDPGNSEGATGPMGYFLDSLFRKETATSTPAEPADYTLAPVVPATPPSPIPVAEVGRIFMNAIQQETMPAQDARYVAQLVMQHTGLSQAEAERRVSETYARAQANVREAKTAVTEAADAARKASAYAALWLFVSLLIGAFVASFAATWGGRQRDA